jgi:membrane protease YdiL (CAAX protease family)
MLGAVSLFLDDASRKLRSGWVVAIFVAVALGAFGVTNTAVSILGLYPRFPLSLDDGRLFFSSAVMVLSAGAPSVICRLILKAELGLPLSRAPVDLPLGFGVGALLVAVAVLIPVLAGQGSLTLFEGPASAVAGAGALQLFALGPTGIGEELMLRGVVLHQLRDGTRPWIAVLLTGATFGLLHLLNPDASAIGLANVALVGVLFGILVLRFSLWFTFGAHVAWNWFEGFVFGQPVSGIAPGHALFVRAPHDRGFFYGGDFGPEAAGVTSVVLAAAIVAALVLGRGSLNAKHS